MAEPVELETARLRLRQWKAEDLDPFHSLNDDPEVMRYFPTVLTRSESDDLARRISGLIDEKGWGFWALETRDEGRFIGFTGLHAQETKFPFSPCVEIGWRLARAYWGKGLAAEAAGAVLDFGFRRLGLREIVAFTALGNGRSQAVMGRLGMVRSEEFEHPDLPEDSPLRRHILYRIAVSARQDRLTRARTGWDAGSPAPGQDPVGKTTR
jgi:RimJ/RimL family protein N-acetyltransferase